METLSIKELKDLLKKAFNEGAAYYATKSESYSFENFIEGLEKDLNTIKETVK